MMISKSGHDEDDDDSNKRNICMESLCICNIFI